MVIRGRGQMKNIAILLLITIFISCASVPPAKAPEKAAEAPTFTQEAQTTPPAPKVKAPEFVPVKESSYPLSTKTVSVSAHNTPLREVLFTIAKTASLNLVMERGVDPSLPVTMNFRDIPIGQALEIIFDSVDYFYVIKKNILFARALGTEMFELGRPGVIHEYKISVGGDILSGTASGGSGGAPLKGDVSLESKADKASFAFWDSIESTLATLLSVEGSDEESDGQQASFIVNRMTGTIIVTASKKDLSKARNYITNLKNVLSRQVQIEARIVEVQLSDALKYGVDWETFGKWLGSNPMRMNASAFNDVVPGNGPRFEVAILDNDNITGVLRALQQQGDVKTLSNPRVNIMNGQTSMLSVGRNTTFISRVETTTTTSEGSAPVTTFTVDTNSILSGVLFGLVPFIDSNNEVTLAITPIVTNLVELEAETIGAAGNSVEIKLPTVDLREMSTTIKVLDGQLVIIGGLIDKKEVLRENKIPFLGDIPVVGTAFKSIEKTYENTELIIMLIPRVIS